MRTLAVVTTHEAKTHLSRLISEVQDGDEIIIARGKKKVAKLVRFDGRKTVRTPGLLAGKFRVADDFDAPLPEEILDSFEGR